VEGVEDGDGEWSGGVGFDSSYLMVRSWCIVECSGV
jgi:hypothetical protein